MKFKVGDKVYVRSKSIGCSINLFTEHSFTPKKPTLDKKVFSIQNYDQKENIYTINGDNFLEGDLVLANEQLKLF